MTMTTVSPLRALAVCAVIIGSLSSTTQAGTQRPQTSAPKPNSVSKPRPAAKAHPACPDAEYNRACASYAELVAAKDSAIVDLTDSGSVSFVCFRPNEDSFFIFLLGGPLAWSKTVVDDTTGTRKPTLDATASSLGGVTEFVEGISDNRTMPLSLFWGDWIHPFNPLFKATQINRRKVGVDESVTVDEGQISADVTYSNRENKPIKYRLRVQRSTRRFSEEYTTEGASNPFLVQRGRCVAPSAFK